MLIFGCVNGMLEKDLKSNENGCRDDCQVLHELDGFIANGVPQLILGRSILVFGE